ncbi:transposase, partial [Enterocloster citroniae]
KDCPYQNQCTGSKDHVKVVSRHVWEGYMEKVEEIRHQTGMKEIYQKRKETIERVFADGKEKHGMRYTQYRGLAKVTMELTLLFACMNLKKLAIWKWRKGGLRKPCSFVWIFEPIYLYIKFKMVPGASHPEPFCLQSEILTFG